LRQPNKRQIEAYLSEVHGKKAVSLKYFGPFSENPNEKSGTRIYEKGTRGKGQSVKFLGYGIPYLLTYKVGAQKFESILSTMRISHGFGHDFRADRADSLILSFDTWNRLPRHGRVIDLGAFKKRDSSLLSLGNTGEFFVLREKVEGEEYYKDLDRIFASGSLEKVDLPRANSLARYLVSIHSKKMKDESIARELYRRKIRDTVGHGECIFGLADSYPSLVRDYLREGELEEIEKKCVHQRWRLKDNFSRLCQVHGDFHPWNILFAKNSKDRFHLLDRSRGEWGEPADDFCGLSINYVFFSLRKYGRLEKEFADLFEEFVQTYLRESGDREILKAAPLFYAFRALVIASPVWYPTLTSETRRKIFNFTSNILDSGEFDPSRVNDYIS
jgi:aminoglycoside phosphotransferase (APT) family kinase protein